MVKQVLKARFETKSILQAWLFLYLLSAICKILLESTMLRREGLLVKHKITPAIPELKLQCSGRQSGHMIDMT